MRKLVLLAGITCMAIALYGQSTRFVGHWSGALQPGLRLAVHIILTGDSLDAVLDSPDQGATGIPFNSISIVSDSIILYLDVAKAQYRALLTSDSTLAGVWKQGPAVMPLALKRGSSTAALLRPQTPVPPFTYKVQEVAYTNADGTVHLAGTLTLPNTPPPHAVAFLITGSGQQDRDETIFNHKPFAVLAHHLANNGMAVLRIDDRGMGKSTGEVATATSADFANDVKAGITYLKNRPDIDRSKIGLIGHSEGGVIAPMVAAGNADISFVVMWAAPVVGGLQTNVQQNKDLLQKAGVAPAAISAFENLHRQILGQFARVKDTIAMRHAIASTYARWKQQQPDSTLSALFATGDNLLGQNVYSMYLGLYKNPWMRYFTTHPFATDLARVQSKVLAINGTKDTQVPAAQNLQAIDSILSKNGNRHFKTVSLPGLNHLLQTANTGEVKEYGIIEETIAPEALNVITTWLKNNILQ